MASDINWSTLEAKAIRNAMYAIDEALVKIKEEVDRNTPIDKGDLIANTKIRPAEDVNGRISGSVYNETEYGKYVEYGVGGKSFNYHKAKRIFYSGVGARMFTRAYNSTKATIIATLNKLLNL